MYYKYMDFVLSPQNCYLYFTTGTGTYADVARFFD